MCLLKPNSSLYNHYLSHTHTVSHHDPELTFNHSFIEPPSSGWVTEGSSFDSDEEEGEALYCVPPREGRNRDTPNFILPSFLGEQNCHCRLHVLSCRWTFLSLFSCGRY